MPEIYVIRIAQGTLQAERLVRRKIRAKAAQTKAWGFVLLSKHEKTVCFDCRKHHPFDLWQKIAGERVVY